MWKCHEHLSGLHELDGFAYTVQSCRELGIVMFDI